MKIVIETERLILREQTVDDAENAYLLNLDPDVVKYTGDAAFASIEEARNFLLNYSHYKIYGFGRWTLINKETNDYLGWCGLKYTPELDEYDIGFRLMKRHWNKGYATEAAKAAIEFGFNNFRMKTIVGRAMKANTDSIKVLQKLGLRFFEDRSCGNEDGVVYKIENKNSVK